jgi:serine/threonine protein kinase
MPLHECKTRKIREDYQTKLIFTGTSSNVYYICGTAYVLKKYLNNESAYKEICMFDYLSDKFMQYTLFPDYIDYENSAIIMKRLSPLSVLPFRSLPDASKANVVMSILSAISELHSVGIVHNDIKLDNILYDPISLSIKLIDFSSSFFECDPINKGTTPLYDSPEATKSRASDIWSLGILLLKLLAVDDNTIISRRFASINTDQIVERTIFDAAMQCLHIDPESRATIPLILRMFTF